MAMTTDEKKKFWLGIGIGALSGSLITGGVCFCVSKKVGKKRAEAHEQERKRSFLDGKKLGYHEGYRKAIDDAKNNGEPAIKSAYDKGYDDGVEDTMRESQKWMAENLIQVDSEDPEAIKKAIEAKNNALNGKFETSPTPSEPEKEKKLTESDYEVKEIFGENKPVNYSGRRFMVQHPESGTTLEYPIELFCDINGRMDDSRIRLNLREYEKDPNKLRMVWRAMGWGEYIPDPDGDIPSAEQINNWDLTVDDLSKMYEESDKKLGDEPEERTIERERYLREVERYRDNPRTGIEYITEQDFSEESHLDKIYIDYYEQDNTFLQPLDNDRKLEDPITDLGVSNGQVLFEHAESDEPDIVHIKNFGQNFVAEITRYHKASSGISDGSAYMNGSTGVVGGTSGV